MDLAYPRLSNETKALRGWWHPVARVSDLGDAPLRTELLGTPWVIVRLGDRLAAFVDRCPHRFAPLSAGQVLNGELECPYHGWRYGPEGRCSAIPALGPDAPLPPKACLVPAAGVEERYGLIWVAPDEPTADIIALPDWGDPRFELGWLTPRSTPMGAGYMLDNFIDFAHFPFLHRATIGADAATVIEGYDVERTGWSFSFSYTQPFNNHEDPEVIAGRRPVTQTRTMVTRYQAPFSLCVTFTNHEQGAVSVIALFVQPMNARQSRLYNFLMRSDLKGNRAALDDALDYEKRILDEDFALQERYDIFDLPLDVREEVHTRADRATLELRRILRDLVATASEVPEEQEGGPGPLENETSLVWQGGR